MTALGNVNAVHSEAGITPLGAACTRLPGILDHATVSPGSCSWPTAASARSSNTERAIAWSVTNCGVTNWPVMKFAASYPLMFEDVPRRAAIGRVLCLPTATFARGSLP
jgi:hypothetical protein